MIGTLMVAPAAALAQAAPTPATPQAPTASPDPDRSATTCAPTRADPRDGNVRPARPSDESGKPLGDTLAQSGGVLCPPPGIDPQMHAPAPNSDHGAMPVIPPPGSPGGDPNMQPK